MIKNIRYVVTSALMRLDKTVTGRNYNWLEQVAIDYMGERQPLDGVVSLKSMYLTIGTSARTYMLPPDCMRISKIALKSGNHLWTLTVDPNLRIPEELFACETGDLQTENQTVYGEGWMWGGNYEQFGLGGGRNENYYRIDGRNIIFSHNIPAGELIIEYLSNGTDISADTLIDYTFAEPFRLYLMSEFCLKEGSIQKYNIHRMEYECQQQSALMFMNAPRIYEMIDALAQSSSWNPG